MHPRLPLLAIVPMAGLIALSAHGATIVKERRVTETKGEGTQTQVMESTFDGPNARIAYVEGGDPMMGEGGYMLLRGNSMYMVNPSTRTYIRMDQAELKAMTDQAKQAQKKNEEAMGAAGGGGKTLKDFQFEPLADEAGPTMLGFPTRHYKYRLKYKISESIPGQMAGMTMDETVDRTEEFWSTTEQVIKGATGRGPMAGMAGEDVDVELPPEVLEAEKTMSSKGFRLKSSTESKETAGMGGAMSKMARIASMGMMSRTEDTTEVRTTTEVLEVRQASVPKETFEVPPGYTESSMMGPGRGMPNLNEMPGEQGESGMPDLNKVPGDN
jgi:hypothetical protein